MKSGMSLIIFGTIFMWGGYLEWEVLRDPLFTFKEGTVIGGFYDPDRLLGVHSGDCG